MKGGVVVGIDDTVEAWTALHRAIQEALLRKCPIRIVHVYKRHRDNRHVQSERDIFDAAMGIAHQRVGASSATGALVLGDPVAVLAGESAGADLLAVGSKRRHATASISLTSVGAGLVGKAKCPILVVREGDENLPVLVGVKDLAATDGMLRFAFDEAYARGRRLSVLHCDQSGSVAGSEVEHELIAATRALGRRYPAVDFSVRILPGDPVQVLIERSWRAGLIVVGIRSGHGSGSVLAGHTSQPVLYGARCSVAVVPEQTTIGRHS